MVREQLDKNSGAILFKKDQESIKLEEVDARVIKLEREIKKLKKVIQELSAKVEPEA